MKLWLTRQHNGLYMLTRLKPLQVRVMGTDQLDSYCQPGEPIGIRNLCWMVLRIVGRKTELTVGESIQIELSGKVY